MVNCYEGCLPVYVVRLVSRLFSGGSCKIFVSTRQCDFFLNFHYYDPFTCNKLRFFSFAGDWPAVGPVPEGEDI